MDVHSREQRRRNMQAIRSSETKMEIALRDAMARNGLRFRKQKIPVFGKPDFCSKKYKIAVFVDGEYFHGKDWEIQKNRIKTNRDFWWKKIEGNIARDELVNKTLKQRGWTVIRFWSNDVKRNPDKCVRRIITTLAKRKNGI